MSTSLHSLQSAISLLPKDLQQGAQESRRVPQFGPYHCEGPFMDSHLHLALETLEALGRGEVDSKVPATVATLMVEAVRRIGIETCWQYILLHDFDKANRLSLKLSSDSPLRTEGGKKGEMLQVSWSQWTAMFNGETGEELDDFCQENGIVQISYYHQSPTDGFPGKHGACTATRFESREDISPLVIRAIRDHELSKTFEWVDIGKAHQMFEGCDNVAVGFVFAANYADLMASHREGGAVDLSTFIYMCKSYQACVSFKDVASRLAATDSLDQHVLSKELDKLRKSDIAFSDETADQVYGRILKVCKLMAFSADQVRSALSGIDLADEVLHQIIEDMTTVGKLSKETGKNLRAANRFVRAALAQI
ncbi:MAG: hypothetical protein HON29_04485 [Candidatus Magasanikbacteria bacterium]|nr:hypothetical protein [Candidatus Magasanikbacteria bacterium]MBT5820333.1 hypothetical protein [Candidatus Magasanikbacteria bacterium]